MLYIKLFRKVLEEVNGVFKGASYWKCTQEEDQQSASKISSLTDGED